MILFNKIFYSVIFFAIVGITNTTIAQNHKSHSLLSPLRLALPENRNSIKYIDIDNDGDPDILRYVINDTIPVQWIDDDDDMKFDDISGDLDSDCLMIDINNNGHYGNGSDLIIDWNDENGNGIADMQVVLENGEVDYKGKWTSHYMYIINTDDKGIFNHIDWDKYKVEGWDKMGSCNFFSNYHGNNLMLKVHISSFDIDDIRYNWENPFLFYDVDNDNYSEMAIRLVDEPISINENNNNNNNYSFKFSHNITLAQLTFDLDNDNGPGNAIDYDMSLKYFGDGFNYSNQVHKFNSMTGLEGSDKYFYDPRFRQNTELIYANHDSAYSLIHDKGKWNGCWLVFDEDDDCHRWERVEFYDPLDPYKIGAKNGGLDNNPQADVAGDRGEWDEDFSGEGNLYVSTLDNKIHLLGAEYGYWRVDQFATYYQGWQGWRGKNIQPEDFVFTEPEIAPIIKYADTDNNGFFDEVSYDMDADKNFEEVISLIALGIPDSSVVIQTKSISYSDYNKLFEEVALESWNQAIDAMAVIGMYGINSSWYNVLLRANSTHEKYNNGYWISYYCYQDLKSYCKINNDEKLLNEIQKAYFSNNWAKLRY